MNIDKATKQIREKQNKRLDGWNTSLPYGIAKDLGLDTTDKTPREVWDEIRKITKESPSSYYAEKAKKGEGTDVKIGDIDEEELHEAYQKISAKPRKADTPADKEFEKFRTRLNRMKETWKKDAVKMTNDDIHSQIKDCDSQIKTFKKDPDRHGENLALAIERKAILNSELKRRPKR